MENKKEKLVEIYRRFEDKGLQIVAMKMMRIPGDLAERHYEAHRDKPFYEGLVRFMTGSPVVVLAIRGVGAIDMCRKMMGATFGSKAESGTIRGDFGTDIERNASHGSDAPETARVEIAYFFNATEIVAPSEALPA